MLTHSPARNPRCHVPEICGTDEDRRLNDAKNNKEYAERELHRVDTELLRREMVSLEAISQAGEGEHYCEKLLALRAALQRHIEHFAVLAASKAKTARSSPPPTSWYKEAKRQIQASSVINNVWNATSNWANAIEQNPAGILATMRVQVDNLAGVISTSGLFGSERNLIQELIAEVRSALYRINPANLNQQVQRQSGVKTKMIRTANDRSTISSNAKAALGCMAYLQDNNLFPGCSPLYDYIHERLEQIFRIMDGDFRIDDVLAVRNQSNLVQPSSENQTLPQSAGAASASGNYQPTYNPTGSTGLQGAQSWGQNSSAPTNPTSLPSADAWTSSQGSDVTTFMSRCRNWAAINGSAALAPHLVAAGVPSAVIHEILPYIGT